MMKVPRHNHLSTSHNFVKTYRRKQILINLQVMYTSTRYTWKITYHIDPTIKMTSSEEYIYNLLDSYWYKHHILTPNRPSIPIPESYKEEYGTPSPKPQKDVIMALTTGNCRNDVEMKGQLRFWAHSVALISI
ncbi:unnamed protein product [Lactuca saligna]|uniref:Uncharacterized protein n=1 Tax=Lactuca saligna TaxID=75948 RepID=A0AA35YU05_LACSI|nr:unnamed protein product [Lactuca saligna]